MKFLKSLAPLPVLALGLVTFFGARGAHAQPFPFVLPPLDSTPSSTDVSALNVRPAGRDGFIGTRGENFVDGRGQKIRFWGVNLNYAACFPPKEIATQMAARLAKFGFNSVRLHQFETSEGRIAMGSTIFKMRLGKNGLPEVAWPLEIDPNQQDRFDFLIAELLKRGIYINLNLHVGRSVWEQDGFPGATRLPDKDKGLAYFDARFEQKNREFARQILTHVNPYTNRALKDEPGVCAVEVANENSLLAFWLDGTLTREGERAFPEPYASDLRESWNNWLRAKYPSEAAFRRAWTENSTPLSGSELLLPPQSAAPPVPTPTPIPTPVSLTTAEDGSVLLPQTAPGAQNVGPEIRASDPYSGVMTRVPTLDAWSLSASDGAQGSASIDEFAGPTQNGQVTPGLSIRLDKAGGKAWSFQLVHGNLPLQSGKVYTLSFWAKADSKRTISLNVWEDRKPFRWLGVTQPIALGSEWREVTLGFRPVGAVPGQVRIALNLGNTPGLLQFGAPSLRAGGRIGPPDEWSLRMGVPLVSAQNEPLFAARRDMAQFLGSLEAQHVRAMRDFLKNEIGVRVPLWHSQISFGGWGGVQRESLGDVYDIHAYWKHPTGWGEGWTVDNVSLAASPLDDPLAAFGLGRVGGKPFVCTEWNAGQPSDFGGEALLMAATHAAQNDWAGVWVFDYHSNGSFERDFIEGFFSIDSHPAKMATAPTAALIFRRADVSESPVTQTLALSREAQWDEVANAPLPPQAGAFLKTWSASGASSTAYRPGLPNVLRVPNAALTGRAQAEEKNAVFPAPAYASLESPTIFRSETGEVVRDAARDLWKVDTPRTKAWVGFWGGKRLQNGEWEGWFEDAGSWSAGALTSLDGQNLARSTRMLLTIVGKAENTGIAWNSRRNSVSNWGKGPTLVEIPIATWKLNTTRDDLKVYALDERGMRKYLVPSTLKNGVLKFRSWREARTVWFEITN